MKVVFGLIVMVFIFWGIGGNSGQTSVLIAEVNGTRITDTQFQQVMRNAVRSKGGSIDEDERRALSQQVIDELVSQEVLLQEADRMDIQVSGEEIAWYVRKFPEFLGPDGKFSSKMYQRGLKRMGFTEGRFEEQIRRQLTLGRLDDIVRSGVHLTDAEVRRAFTEQRASMDLSWVAIPDAAFLSKVQVDDTTVDAWLSTNEADVRATYEQDFERLYHRPRKATLATITLRSDLDQGQVSDEELRARMDTIQAELDAGADFAATARRWSEDISAINGGALGTRAEPDLDPAIARAVFQTEAGQRTQIVETGFGLQILNVQEIIPEESTAFEEVKHDIARDLLRKRDVGVVAGEFAERLLAAWKESGAPPEAMIAEAGLDLRDSPDVTPGRPLLLGAPESPGLSSALRAVQQEGVIDSVFPTDEGRILAAVTRYTSPDPAELELDGPTLQAQLTAFDQMSFQSAWKDDLVKRSKVVQHWIP